MSIDSQETEDDNDSGKGPGAENLSPPSSPKLSDIVPPDETNEIEKGAGEKDSPLSGIHLESDENSYDSENLKNLHDQIKLNESSLAQDPDKHAIELKNLKSKYDNALKAKKNYNKKKKIGKPLHPIHSVADHHEYKAESHNIGRR